MPDRILPRINFFLPFISYIIAISLILKTKSNRECSMIAVKSLMAIVKFDGIFKNVFREVGMLEALIGKKHALKRYYQFALNTSCFWGSMESNITPIMQFHEIIIIIVEAKIS